MEEIPARDRVYLSQMATALDRSAHTIRQWEAQGLLPSDLCPRRDQRQWRYWEKKQVKLLKQWMVDNKMIPGRGLRNYNPSKHKVRQVLRQMRAPRPDRRIQRED